MIRCNLPCPIPWIHTHRGKLTFKIDVTIHQWQPAPIIRADREELLGSKYLVKKLLPAVLHAGISPSGVDRRSEIEKPPRIPLIRSIETQRADFAPRGAA